MTGYMLDTDISSYVIRHRPPTSRIRGLRVEVWS